MLPVPTRAGSCRPTAHTLRDCHEHWQRCQRAGVGERAARGDVPCAGFWYQPWSVTGSVWLATNTTTLGTGTGRLVPLFVHHPPSQLAQGCWPARDPAAAACKVPGGASILHSDSNKPPPQVSRLALPATREPGSLQASSWLAAPAQATRPGSTATPSTGRRARQPGGRSGAALRTRASTRAHTLGGTARAHGGQDAQG